MERLDTRSAQGSGVTFAVDNRLRVDGEERIERVKPKRVGERAGAVRLRPS